MSFSKLFFQFVLVNFIIVSMLGCGDKKIADENDTEKAKDSDTTKDSETATNLESDSESAIETDSETDTDFLEGVLWLDDFEDGDNHALVDGDWYVYDDKPDGGLSEISGIRNDKGDIEMVGDGYKSTTSLYAEYTFGLGDNPWSPYSGFSLSFAGPMDMTKYDGFRLMHKGGEVSIRFEMPCVTNYDFHRFLIPASADWQEIQLPFSALAQQGWGGAYCDADFSKVKVVSFEVRGADGESDWVQIDNLGLVEDIPRGEPDMEIHPASPPEKETIDTIAITNPLQERAMLLSKGYNLSDWLEARKYTGFDDYNETYIENLAAAGFKALRLPIDLDMYIEEAVVDGENVTLTLSDDLWTILDSFAAWTETNGMSLTIDYHQYGSLIDMSNQEDLLITLELWRRVAEHFAADPRQDLFYELLNELELSLEKPYPTSAKWTEFAEKIVSAIRENDTVHTILFGDVNYNSLDSLVSRPALLSDTNIIYVFHFYEPFIFTHQGTSWTDAQTVKNLPYPYAEENWSEYYEDFGLNFAAGWVVNQALKYYINGTKNAMYNRIVKVKKWAVENNVPLVCNELGVYPQGSAKDTAIVNYYTDLIDIFKELEIPWQTWFTLMDAKTGTIDTNISSSLQLDTK